MFASCVMWGGPRVGWGGHSLSTCHSGSCAWVFSPRIRRRDHFHVGADSQTAIHSNPANLCIARISPALAIGGSFSLCPPNVAPSCGTLFGFVCECFWTFKLYLPGLPYVTRHDRLGA